MTSAPVPDPPQPGGVQPQVAAGGLEILEIIGSGGMGYVAEARDRRLGRTVAIKWLRPERLGQPGSRERFIAEAQIAGQLEHPGIVPVYDSGVNAHGQPFYIMRRIKGVTFSRVLEELKEEKPEVVAQYPLAVLLTVFQKLCDAVAYAHARKVIHRDLKPENIMMGEFGEVVVMDWGLAKSSTAEAEASGETMAGNAPNLEPVRAGEEVHTLDNVAMGTPGFMAPELAGGQANVCNERVDVYSLGAILYNILTLRPPIRGRDPKLMMDRTRTGDIRPPTEYNRAGWFRSAKWVALTLPHCPGGRIPLALSAVAMKALATQPQDRYSTVRELQAELSAYQAGFVTSAEQASLRQVLSLWSRRHRAAICVGALIALICAGFTWKLAGTLRALRENASTSYAVAQSLVNEWKFELALRKVASALEQEPRNSEYWLLKGNILQTLWRFEEARAAYRSALKNDAQAPFSHANLALCQKMLAGKKPREDWSPAMLLELYEAMVIQGRGAEAASLAPKIKGAQDRLFECWQNRLRELGIEGRLTRDEKKRLSLEVTDTNLASLDPFRGLPLTRLEIAHKNERISDLRPLQSMPLEKLRLTDSTVFDLTPLKGLPLRHLHLQNCPNLIDLSPLRGMRLENIFILQSKVMDISPLQGMPLRHLAVQYSPLRDISVIGDMPLESLQLNSTLVSDLRPLKNLRLNCLDLCKDLGDVEQRLAASQVTNIQVLAGQPLEHLSLDGCHVRDLSPLVKMPLEELSLRETLVTNLEALRGMPLRHLRLDECAILADLSPIFRSCPSLERLWLSDQTTSPALLNGLTNFPHLADLTFPPKTRELSVIRGLPGLKRLDIMQCQWPLDLSPVSDCRQLEFLRLPRNPLRLETLRALPNLKEIEYQGRTMRSEDFWKEHAAPK